MPRAAQPAELPCSRCGYDLAGLGGNTPCPECGSEAAKARAGAALVQADPTSLQRLSRVLRLWGLIVLVGGAVAAIDTAYYRLNSVLFEDVVSNFDMTYGVFFGDAAVTIYFACVVIASTMLVQHCGLRSIPMLAALRSIVWILIACRLASFAMELGSPRVYFTGGPPPIIDENSRTRWWVATIRYAGDIHFLQIAVCLLLRRIATVMGRRRLAKSFLVLPILALLAGVASDAWEVWMMTISTAPPDVVWMLSECSDAKPALDMAIGVSVLLLSRHVKQRAAHASTRPAAASPAPEHKNE